MAPGISYNFPESWLQKLQGIIKYSCQVYTNFHLLFNRVKLTVRNGVAAGCFTNYSRVMSHSSGVSWGIFRPHCRFQGFSRCFHLHLLPSWVPLHVGWLRTRPLLHCLIAETTHPFPLLKHIFFLTWSKTQVK